MSVRVLVCVYVPVLHRPPAASHMLKSNPISPPLSRLAPPEWSVVNNPEFSRKPRCTKVDQAQHCSCDAGFHMSGTSHSSICQGTLLPFSSQVFTQCHSFIILQVTPLKSTQDRVITCLQDYCGTCKMHTSIEKNYQCHYNALVSMNNSMSIIRIEKEKYLAAKW